MANTQHGILKCEKKVSFGDCINSQEFEAFE
jgi:hypothetical protein